MDIVELKNKIENCTLNDSILILKYTDNKFLCKHYIDNIAKNKNKEIQYIDSLEQLEGDYNLFDINCPYLRVLDVDNLSEYVDPSLTDVVIICKGTPKDLKVDYVDMTKLVNWQIEDFVKYRLSGLTDTEIKWLCENCKYDIYRLDNECKKLEIFAPTIQDALFKEQCIDNSYCDLNNESIFNLTEAIFKKDKESIRKILENREYIDLEPAGLISILLKSYYKLLVTLNCSSWNSSIEGIISEKQYRFYKAVYSKLYSWTELINIYETLTSIDYKLKSGQIDYNMIIDYIIIKLLG